MSSIYRKTASKAWNFYQIWIWRNGAQIFRLEHSNRIFRKLFVSGKQPFFGLIEDYFVHQIDCYEMEMNL